MGKLTVKVVTGNIHLPSILMEDESPRIGSVFEISDDVSITLKNKIINKGMLEDGAILEFVLLFGAGVGSSFIASWLYNKLQKNIAKNKSIRIEINGIEVKDQTEEGIKNTIIESIRIEK